MQFLYLPLCKCHKFVPSSLCSHFQLPCAITYSYTQIKYPFSVRMRTPDTTLAETDYTLAYSHHPSCVVETLTLSKEVRFGKSRSHPKPADTLLRPPGKVPCPITAIAIHRSLLLVFFRLFLLFPFFILASIHFALLIQLYSIFNIHYTQKILYL